MTGKPLDHDTRVSIIQCHTLDLQVKDIVMKNSVSEARVCHLVAEFKASSCACIFTPIKNTERPVKIYETSLRVLKWCMDVIPTHIGKKLKDVTVKTVSAALEDTLNFLTKQLKAASHESFFR